MQRQLQAEDVHTAEHVLADACARWRHRARESCSPLPRAQGARIVKGKLTCARCGLTKYHYEFLTARQSAERGVLPRTVCDRCGRDLPVRNQLENISNDIKHLQ
jgi:hypothetical protein